jgi:hypothetical protein
MVSSWCNARGVQWLENPPYSPNLAPADFFLLKKAKMGAGRPEPGPGRHQEPVGGGHEITDRCRLRCCLQKLTGALQKVRPPRRRVHHKILRNEHPSSSNRCQFIYRFAFVCIHTSYKIAKKSPGIMATIYVNIEYVWTKFSQIAGTEVRLQSPLDWPLGQ